MESVSKRIPLDEMTQAIRDIPGVIGLHEFHISCLTADVLVCSLHLRIKNLENSITITFQAKRILLKYGIHTSAIQIETESVHH